MIYIVGLIIFNIVVSALQPVHHDSHAWTYDQPYGFRSQGMILHGETEKEVIITGNSGNFLSMWTAMTTIVFSMIGFETVSIAAAECKTPETSEAIKMGTRMICLRIILLYTLGTLVVGFNVPYNDENLRNLAINSITPGQNSIFILAAVRNNIHGIPHLFNAFFIFSATTSGINSLYLASRVLHALASIPEVWPNNKISQSIKFRLERTSHGVPHGAIFTSWLFGLLAFLAANKTPAVQLGRMATNSVVSMLIVYAIICPAYLQFYSAINNAAESKNAAVNAAGINRHVFERRNRQYPYRSRGQWLKAIWGFVGTSLFALFNGWQSFTDPFSASDFVGSYISIPIFLLIVMGYHIMLDGWNPRDWKRTRNERTNLTNPPPKTVVIRLRAAHLQLPTIDSTENNSIAFWKRARAIGKWVWVWTK